MNSEAKKRQIDYPHGNIRVYWSATLTVLSVILAILILPKLELLLSYLLLSALLTAILLAFKMRFLRHSEVSETESSAFGLRSLLILVIVLVVALAVPLLLAPLYPELWFISLISYTTSVSVAEVLSFLIIKKG